MITSGADLSILILAADTHWRDAGWWTRLRAVVLGKRHRVEHLGCVNRITIWRGVPYLWWIGEVRA
ncbi:hypothetical protein ROE7235_03871 [Roseibaca ekhonensis]|jgi:hypothetical protein|uniref:Uncharacterized protein n=1 Tax=Roseinatronobacter ekhonensis TaxID=254356 RepID=A0A3B0MWE2_9RHOB|nr:hypothetical protein [Roseibaca ekhonensis]SUZ34089.1 hypothetical protein ROE7235_03871 [Roseibaca ekhonensis]